MGLIDVSRALTSPYLTTSIDVFRRVSEANSYGEVEKSVSKLPGVVAVVCDAGPDDLKRHPEFQEMGYVLSVVTQFRLYGPAKDGEDQEFQPDVIRHGGNFFVVSALDPYLHFGSGFVQALATAYKWVGRPPA